MQTRDAASMRAWAQSATTPTLRACRDEAERDGDAALVRAIDDELRRRAA